MNPNPRAVTNQKLLPLVGTLAMIANLFVFVFVGYSAYESRLSIQQAASIETMNLATTLEHSLSEKLRLVDLALLTAQRGFNHQRKEKTLSKGFFDTFLISLQENIQEIEGLRVTDAQGVVRFNTSTTGGKPVSLADRDYFIHVRDTHDNRAFIGKAVKSRITGTWILPMARRLSDEQGRFLGMVYATINVNAISKDFANLSMSENGAIFLRDSDLRLVSRYPLPPGTESTIGKQNASPELTAKIQSGLHADTYIPSKTSDGIERIYSYRKLRNNELYVMVAKSNEVYLAPWYSQVTRYFGFACLFLGISLYALRQLRRSLQAQDEYEIALENSKNTLETITQFSTDWVYWRNETRDQFIYNSPLCERVCGYTEQDLAEDPQLLDTIIHPEDSERWQNHFACTDHHTDDEYRIITKTGETRWISHGCRQVFDQDGKRNGRRGSNIDITERKLAELALREATEAAKAANTAKSRFLAVMSHELRTPLNGIMGMAQMLMMKDINEAERIEFASTIQSSGKALLAQLNDILDHAKIESGRLEIDQIPFSPATLLEEVDGLYAQNAQLKNIRLSHQIELNHTYFLGDPVRIRQILMNLVSNAIKFTDQGEVRTKLMRVRDGQRLRFEVIDSGIGIPESKITALFQAFSQVDDSSTRRHDGTGLGLAICQSLVRLMGGEIGVLSVAGKGSTFWFELPCKLPEGEEITDEQHHIQTTALASTSSPLPWRVLVADDNATNRKLLEKLLEKLGVTNIRLVENGEQAVQAVIEEHHFDLILMDCLMPVMDGFEATSLIRQLEDAHGTARQQIVAITASAYAEDREKCLKVGMDQFLTKPLQVAELRTVIQKLQVS